MEAAMNTPTLPPFALQAAVIRGCLSAARAWTDTCFNVARQNLSLLHSTVHRRADDAHRPAIFPHGAYWTDFYGHREHDIDVEHDL